MLHLPRQVPDTLLFLPRLEHSAAYVYPQALFVLMPCQSHLAQAIALPLVHK